MTTLCAHCLESDDTQLSRWGSKLLFICDVCRSAIRAWVHAFVDQMVRISDEECAGKALQDSTTKYHGVFWNKRKAKWQAMVRIAPRKWRWLGLYVDKVVAAEAYDAAAGELGLPLNFPK